METMVRWVVLEQENEKLKAVAAKYKNADFSVRSAFENIAGNDEPTPIAEVLDKSPALINYIIGYGRFNAVGDTMLHSAVKHNRVDRVRFLLKYKPHIDAINSYGRTPLHLAAASNWGDSGNAEMIQLLIDQDADPNAFDLKGLTPVHRALLGGKIENARLMLKGGGAMDLSIAAGIGDLNTMRRYLKLYKQTEIYLKTRGGAALCFAAASGQTDAIELLHASGVSPSVNVDGQPPLYYAIQHGGLAAAESLLERGASLDLSMTSYLNGGLIYAAYKNDAKMIQLLVKHGGDLETLGHDEETPLHIAAHYGGAASVRALLDAGANIDARRGKEGYRPCGPATMGRPHLDTPLHLAAGGTRPEVVKLLLDNGAQIELKNGEQLRPLDVARQSQKEDPKPERKAIIDLLQRATLNKRIAGGLKPELE